MEDITTKIQTLLGKEEWTEAEKAWLHAYIASGSTGELTDVMEKEFQQLAQTPDSSNDSLAQALLSEIQARLIIEKPTKTFFIRTPWKALAAAAVVTGILLASYYRYSHPSGRNDDPANVSLGYPLLRPDKTPGNQVVLKLADGSTVALNGQPGGHISDQGGAHIVRTANSISYQGITGTDSASSASNMLSTPRGTNFQLVLSDGTRVWLNAASSISYPTVFKDPERQVEITGEVYFEVAKNAAKPFTVKTGKSAVRVLGTHFNVSAYEDESFLTTTLLEGSVQFIHNGSTTLLQPGQQSQLSGDGKVKVNTVNTNEVMAWKNGMFHFEQQDIRTVMNQLARWYDIEIIYSPQLCVELFSADIPRSTSLAGVLNVLQLTRKINFRVEGKKVFVNDNL